MLARIVEALRKQGDAWADSLLHAYMQGLDMQSWAGLAGLPETMLSRPSRALRCRAPQLCPSRPLLATLAHRV